MDITYNEYVAIYGTEITETEFNRLKYDAERFVDIQTTGVDNVHKLDVAFPTETRDAEAVKRCVCALIHLQHAIENAQSMATGENGHGAIASKSSGSESVSYVRVNTVIDAAVSDNSARTRLYADTVRNYLSGICDANGVNILYMGEYPCIRTL